jgi:soluble lytic murein transglycosylase-like protein
MSVPMQAAKLLLQTVLTIGSATGLLYTAYVPPKTAAPAPVVQVQPQAEARTPEFEKAFFQAAKVYGKAGCGDMELAEMTAKHALAKHIPSNILAAQIAVESSCNNLAISNKGAVGLTQILVPLWAPKYNQFQTLNLFNSEDSLTIGTEILSDLIQKHGLRDGLRRYNGAGPDAEAYAAKILALAGAPNNASKKEAKSMEQKPRGSQIHESVSAGLREIPAWPSRPQTRQTAASNRS